MAFAVEPYIFDWIFFDDSSSSKLGGFNKSEERNRCPPEVLYLRIVPVWLNVCLHISSGVGCLCCLFRFVGSQGLDEG